MTAPARAVVRVPATTANLGPGFDAFGVAVSLHLEARLVAGGVRRTRVASHGEGAGELPDDDSNLLWRSLLALCAHAGVTPPGDVAVDVLNRIPLARGLGSSSAAIVAGLGLARAACELEVSDLELVRIASDIEGHPDNVAPAVLGGLVVAARTDAGGLVVRRAQPHARLRPVALIPQDRQLTTAARTLLPEALERQEVVDHTSRAGHVLGAILGAWPVAPELAGDRLHEPARLAAMQASGAVVAELRAGGIHAWLSGAGPSVCAAIGLRDTATLLRCDEIGAGHGFVVRPVRWELSGLTAMPVSA
ncbi:MAG: homoserine kinase [Actinobacteria bacterium]|nr:homoserine kinase [Actinomycetota bacterium]